MCSCCNKKTWFRPNLNECWVFTEQLKSRLQEVGMKFIRSVMVIIRCNKIRNDMVRRKEMEVELLITGVDQQQLK